MKKDLLAICIVVFLIVVICLGTNIQSVDDYYLTHIDDITEDSETVFLTIKCDTILGFNEALNDYNWNILDQALRYDKYVPSDGIILMRTEYVLRKDDTVFKILDRAVRHNRIQMECVYSNNFGSIYVQGINHLYEFSCGELSGWMFMVNGTFPNYGSSKFNLKDGDEIVWAYTCDLGRDVGSDWGGQIA